MNKLRDCLMGLIRFREGGLLAVIVLLAVLLTVLGGNVQVKVRGGTGEQGRPAFAERTQNSFANVDTLLTLMKESCFIAVMAIGATMVIILGGIDLSVGAVYAFAAVVGALVFHRFGACPTFESGGHAELSFWQVAVLGGGP